MYFIKRILANRNRIFGLDLLRFFAILLVLISHGKSILLPLLGKNNTYLSLGGFWGVELFFVLSGFLIGGILLNTYESSGFTFSVLLNFWKRRWYRTLPNYYLILLLNIIFLYFLSGKFILSDVRYFSFFVFSQNVFTPHPNFFTESWSLSVEEWFYLSFPIVLFIVTVLVSKLLIWSKKSKFLWSILFVYIISLLLKIILVIEYDPIWSSEIRKIVLLRLDSILTGVFFAWFSYYYNNYFNTQKKIMMLLSVLLLAVSGVVFYLDIIVEKNISFFSKTLYFNMTSLGFAFLLPYSNSYYAKKSFWVQTVTLISLISYSLYLVHFSFVLKIIDLFSDYNNSVMASIGMFISYLLISIFISTLLYKYFENPMTNLRNR